MLQQRVAFTWHWQCRLVPETKWALPHYHPGLARVVAELRAGGVEVDGHGHPRALHDLAPIWARLKVRTVASFDQVVAQDSVLVGDNTSALYEWAALGRPVVVLNAPWYRRGVEHGLRFWSHVPGRQVDHPDELTDAILEAVEHPGRGEALRRAATAEVYAHLDGRAADRAAAAIVKELTGG